MIKGIFILILASAIFHAEGGNNTKHPYGIMTQYQHTSPRQACINTIKHQLRLWDGKGDFIMFFGKTYAPTKNATNDPNHLNQNWVKNVKYFYDKGVKENEMSELQKGGRICPKE